MIGGRAGGVRPLLALALLSVAVECGGGDFLRLTMIESLGELMGRADLEGHGGESNDSGQH